jgi:hypothetical protein
MSNLKIKFIGGEGGAWLSHLIFSLETNQPPESSKNKKNFHQNQGSTTVDISHFPEEPYKFFHGNAIFNIHLNWVIFFVFHKRKRGFD